LACFLGCASIAFAQDDVDTPVEVTFTEQTATYEVRDVASHWMLSGQVKQPAGLIRNRAGKDKNGEYQEIAFEWNQEGAVEADIRTYKKRRAVLFRLIYRQDRTGAAIPFPNFSRFPNNLSSFSYKDQAFAAPNFGLSQTGTPWLFFDAKGASMVLSPASNFMVESMLGDGTAQIGVSLNSQVKQIPKGFEQDSLLVFDDGIGKAWNSWGECLRNQYGKSVPGNDSDPLLKSFGYWTDNGADYYYNYDTDKGYAKTLLALWSAYQDEGIPLGYMQLDSWWYDKTVDDPAGRKGGAAKNSKLPPGMWNRYGGLWQYQADKDLFPNGLDAFQASLGLPLAVHNRWIDANSPYHQKYKISGVAAIDPKWWNDIVGYLSSCGVVCYEQDWLSEIYAHSPEMAGNIGVGDAFADGMADACEKKGLDMQYCMATPRFFLQGVKYSNLTTIRTSDDRFEPSKWRHFLYTSQFAQAVGVWPWCDVFKSDEMGNLILSVLSGGPVGIGDAMGKENKANILMAARPDGLLVKSDSPIVPCDQTYIDETQRQDAPFLASTYTDPGGPRTVYLFGFPRKDGNKTFTFRTQDFGVTQRAYLSGDGEARYVEPGVVVSHDISDKGYAFMGVYPVTKTGVALLGQQDMIVPTGKARFPVIDDRATGLFVRVSFAKGERTVEVVGMCPTHPTVKASKGSATLTDYDVATGKFVIVTRPAGGDLAVEFSIVGKVEETGSKG